MYAHGRNRYIYITIDFVVMSTLFIGEDGIVIYEQMSFDFTVSTPPRYKYPEGFHLLKFELVKHLEGVINKFLKIHQDSGNQKQFIDCSISNAVSWQLDELEKEELWKLFWRDNS